ncbi:MAG: electron transfer flavoprotein subunit beta/FixA family protein [Sphaerochaetaceae bacterium]|nr:electron transfer flavoprotein subunit beta/FixA family protein [Sphaerochaetaceae bacterium]
MNILVCVKQVPGSNNVKVDEKGLLIRPKVGNKLNPYDLFAIETALTIKDLNSALVDVISMGPPQASEVLSECLWMGCDNGYLISDRAFGGADVLATSYTLCSGIKQAQKSKAPYDLIICGKQTTDGDTAQVGSELAEHLGLPHVSNVASIKEITPDYVIVTSLRDNLIVTERTSLPAILCTDAEINTPRLPSYKRKKNINSVITTITINDVEDKDVNHYGLKGSPTQVQRVFAPEKNTQRQMFSKENCSNLAEELENLLKAKKFV